MGNEYQEREEPEGTLEALHTTLFFSPKFDHVTGYRRDGAVSTSYSPALFLATLRCDALGKLKQPVPLFPETLCTAAEVPSTDTTCLHCPMCDGSRLDTKAWWRFYNSPSWK